MKLILFHIYLKYSPEISPTYIIRSVIFTPSANQNTEYFILCHVIASAPIGFGYGMRPYNKGIYLIYLHLAVAVLKKMEADLNEKNLYIIEEKLSSKLFSNLSRIKICHQPHSLI